MNNERREKIVLRQQRSAPHSLKMRSLFLFEAILFFFTWSISIALSEQDLSNTEQQPDQSVNFGGGDELPPVKEAKPEELLIDWEGLERNAAHIEPSPVEGHGEPILQDHGKCQS